MLHIWYFSFEFAVIFMWCGTAANTSNTLLKDQYVDGMNKTVINMKQIKINQM